MIRESELKDLPEIHWLFMGMVNYLQCHGVNCFCKDEKQLSGALMEMLVVKMQDQSQIILVNEKDGKIKNFLIGAMEKMPNIFEHNLIAFLEYVFPVTFSSTQLAHEFYKWGKSKGASKYECSIHIAHDQASRLLKMFQRQGFMPQQIIMDHRI